MIKKVALAVAIAVLVPAAGGAQFFPKLEEQDTRNQAVMQALLKEVTAKPDLQETPAHTFVDYALTCIRGGNGSKKPLGQYTCEPNVEFKSDYKKMSPELQCKFAYDLHEHLTVAGYDWPTIQRTGYKWMPYEKQRQFADFWWLRNCPEYKSMGFLFKDGFLHDALIDATNIYGWYGRKAWGCSSYIAFEDASVGQIVKQK